MSVNGQAPKYIELEYIGGSRWIPGIPAADHVVKTDGEAAARVATGLYRMRVYGAEGIAK
jgi:hypothetical protein